MHSKGDNNEKKLELENNVNIKNTQFQIESKPENLEQEGLYRIPGDVVQVQKIRLEVDQVSLYFPAIFSFPAIFFNLIG
jgi:hypothetical protein